MFPNVPSTVGLFINANSVMGKMIACVLLYTYQCVCLSVSLCEHMSVHMLVSARLLLCVSVYVCVRMPVYEETLLQTVQIYLYANWILVKRFGVPHGLSPLVKWG